MKHLEQLFAQKLKYKKGMVDITFIPVLVFILIISILIVAMVFFFISDGLSAEIPFFADADMVESMSFSFVSLIYFMYFGLPVVAIILAFFSGSHPIFIPIGILLLLISILISGVMQYTMISMVETLPFASALLENSISLLLIEYYPLIMLIFGIMIIIAQFVRE